MWEKDLSKSEKDQIRHFIQAPEWQTMLRAADIYTQRIRGRDVISGKRQWDFMRESLLREGEVCGVKRFLEQLIKWARESTE